VNDGLSKRSPATIVTASTLVALAMFAQHVASIATRDALFLSNYPATALPFAMAASVVLSLIVVLAMSRFADATIPGTCRAGGIRRQWPVIRR